MYRSGTAMAWNVFKFCTALRGLGSIMILLVIGIVGATYYALVVSNYGPLLFHGGLDSLSSFAILLPFHALVTISPILLSFRGFAHHFLWIKDRCFFFVPFFFA